MARTQQERREATIERLLDASIATISDVGYARASATAITKRAGLSEGALFRHFDTMGDFMTATAQEVMRRQLHRFNTDIALANEGAPDLPAAIQVLSNLTTNSTNAVLYELMIAARTDERLRTTLRAELETYATRIVEIARSLEGAGDFPDEVLTTLVAIVTSSFDGAAIMGIVLPQPSIESQRGPLLVHMLTALAEHPAAPR